MSKEKMQARVLVLTVINGLSVNPNDLVIGSEDLLEPYIQNGSFDADEKAVKYCLDAGAEPIDLEPVTVPDEVTDQMIIDAILELDKDDESLWSKDNKPKCEAIADVIGEGVTIHAADRDAAWEIIQSGE